MQAQHNDDHTNAPKCAVMQRCSLQILPGLVAQTWLPLIGRSHSLQAHQRSSDLSQMLDGQPDAVPCCLIQKLLKLLVFYF